MLGNFEFYYSVFCYYVRTSGCILALQWFNWPVKKCFNATLCLTMNYRRHRETFQRIRRYERVAQLYVPHTSLLLSQRPRGARRVTLAKSYVTSYEIVVIFHHRESVPRSTLRRTRVDAASQCHLTLGRVQRCAVSRDTFAGQDWAGRLVASAIRPKVKQSIPHFIRVLFEFSFALPNRNAVFSSGRKKRLRWFQSQFETHPFYYDNLQRYSGDFFTVADLPRNWPNTPTDTAVSVVWKEKHFAKFMNYQILF